MADFYLTVLIIFSLGSHFSSQHYTNMEVMLFTFASFCDKSTSKGKVKSLPLVLDPVSERGEKKEGNDITAAKIVCEKGRVCTMIPNYNTVVTNKM